MDRVHVQADFTEVLSDVTTEVLKEDFFWVKIIPHDLGKLENGEVKKVIELKFKCFKDNLSQLMFECTDNKATKFIRRKNHEFTLIHLGKMYNLKSATSVYNLKTDSEIVSFDISSDGENMIAFGDSKGNIDYGSIKTSNLKLQLNFKEAHLTSHVSKIKIFPSNKVMLSSGLSDYTIKIWSLVDGSNPRIMREQKGKITDLFILGKGRNFLSSSLDGSIVIWECGQGKPACTFRRIKDLKDGVNVLKVRQLEVDDKEQLTSDLSNENDLFFDLKGKICYAGHESGTISIWDLNSQTSLREYQSINGYPVTSLTLANNKNELYAGYFDGSIACWDYNDLEKPKWVMRLKELQNESELKNGEAKINDMVLVSNEDKLLVSCGPNMLVEISVDNNNNTDKEITYCIGYDQYTRVNQLTVSRDGKYCYCCGKDGLLIRYSV